MAGVDTIKCQATGCWEPNALPRCIDESLLDMWSEEASSVSLVAVLVSICAATIVISAVMAICGVMACRRYPTTVRPLILTRDVECLLSIYVKFDSQCVLKPGAERHTA